MAKRKTAPIDSTSLAKKTKSTRAVSNTKVTKPSASKPCVTKAAAKLDPAKVLDTVVTNDTPTGAREDTCAIPTNSTSKTLINDEEEFEIDFDAVEDDDNNTTLVGSDDDKIEKAVELLVEEKPTGEAIATKVDAVSNAVAVATDIETTPEEATITNTDDGNKDEPEKLEVPNAAEVVEAHSNDEWKTEYARQALINGLNTQLTYSPAILSMAGASTVGDTVDVTLTVNGLKIEVSFKVLGSEEPAQKDQQAASEDINTNTPSETQLVPTFIEATKKPRGLSIDTDKAQNTRQTAAQLSANTLPTDTRAHIPCKFGESCNKGDNCPFDHNDVTIKKKLCTWVNTTKGCAKGDNCHFSHDHKGKMCSRSASRMTCENGAACAFMHKDECVKSSKKSMIPLFSQFLEERPGSLASSSSASIASLLSPGLLRNDADQNEAQNAPIEYDDSYNAPKNAPTGPRNLGRGAGQKRRAESEGNGFDAPRPHKYQQQTGYVATGPQKARGGRMFAQPRGGHGHRGKNNGRGGRHNP